MHVSSDKDPVEIRGGTMYYQLDEFFSYKGNSSMEKDLSPSGLRGWIKG